MLFLYFSIFSENLGTLFSITPFIEIEGGKHGEYILDDNKKTISALEWKLFPLIMTGLSFRFDYNHLNLETEALICIPSRSGNMNDSDWKGNLKYIYSENQAFSILNYRFSLNANYNFLLKSFLLGPVIKFEYHYDSFEAKNGHGWYGISKYSKNGKDVSWDDPNASYFDYIPGYSDYTMQIFYTYAGLKAETIFNDRFTLSLTSLISPYTYVFSQDNHYNGSGQKTKYVIGKQNIFFMRFKNQIDFNLYINSIISLSGNISATIGGKSKGCYKFYSASPFYEDSFYISGKGVASSDIYLFATRLGMKINL